MNIQSPESDRPRPRFIEPGMPPFEPGTERYFVRGGGAAILRLLPDDELAIVDLEGQQRCELAVFSPDGKPDPAALGLKSAVPSSGIARLLLGNSEETQEVARVLRDHGIPAGVDRVAVALPGGSFAGERVAYRAERNAICIVHAPGGPMAPDAQDAPTDLLAVVRRARPDNRIERPLPPPLGDIVAEYRIDRCTAQSYEVKEGQYIQIIDVDGRQCSDFLAFNARRLQSGAERGLDLSATRTFMGSLYPLPGLASKYFDRDLQPLCDVIRDTCGRHDSFGLACTARFYEDAGYPGHSSCSENFNDVLAPYGLEKRPGWQAINLFYNTGVNAQNAIFLNDPWSRPGDYVLMRAMSDLICGSSACPDDIDATNAWNPTDVHIRIYGETENFSRGVAFRMSADSEPRLTRETGFHPRTSALTRNFAEYRGFWLPQRFNNEGPTAEYWACRENAAVYDISALRKFEVLGQDAEALLQLACTRNIRKLADGEVVYTAMCYEHGGMLDDATVFRLAPDRYRLIGGDEYDGRFLRELADQRGLRQVWVKSSTDQLHNISVQGPKSRDILKGIVWTAPARPRVEEIDWFRFTVGRIGDYNGIPIVVSRTGYTGELGYEIFCHPKDAPALWDTVWEAGIPHGMAPLGLEALDMLRIEAGLIFFGYEFDDQVDPFEAGIGFTVALKGNSECIAHAALSRRKANPQRVLVGLELAGQEPAGHGDCVHVGRAQVGVVTSGVRSPILGKCVALCRMDVAYAAIGTEVEIGKIDGHQKRIPAKVVRHPFYDPDKTKPRS